jgi:hypothetical protein
MGAEPAGQKQPYRAADSRNAAETTPDPRPKDEEGREVPAPNHIGNDLTDGQERDLTSGRGERGDGGATEQVGRELAVREKLDRCQDGRWSRRTHRSIRGPRSRERTSRMKDCSRSWR